MKYALPLLAVCCIFSRIQSSSTTLKDVVQLFTKNKETEKDYQFRLAKQMAERLYGEEVVNKSLLNIDETDTDDKEKISAEKREAGTDLESSVERSTEKPFRHSRRCPEVAAQPESAGFVQTLNNNAPANNNNNNNQVGIIESEGVEVKTVLPDIPVDFSRIPIEQEDGVERKMQNIDAVIDAMMGAAGTGLRRELGLCRREGVVKSNAVGAVEENKMAKAISYITSCVRSTLKEAMNPQPCVPLTHELQLFLSWMMHGPEGNSACPPGNAEFKKYPHYLFHESRHRFETVTDMNQPDFGGKQKIQSALKSSIVNKFTPEKSNQNGHRKSEQDVAVGEAFQLTPNPIEKSYLRPQRSITENKLKKNPVSIEINKVNYKRYPSYILKLPNYLLDKNSLSSDLLDDSFQEDINKSKRSMSLVEDKNLQVMNPLNYNYDDDYDSIDYETEESTESGEFKKAVKKKVKKKKYPCGTFKIKKNPHCCPTAKNWQTLMTDAYPDPTSESLENLLDPLNVTELATTTETIETTTEQTDTEDDFECELTEPINSFEEASEETIEYSDEFDEPFIHTTIRPDTFLKTTESNQSVCSDECTEPHMDIVESDVPILNETTEPLSKSTEIICENTETTECSDDALTPTEECIEDALTPTVECTKSTTEYSTDDMCEDIVTISWKNPTKFIKSKIYMESKETATKHASIEPKDWTNLYTASSKQTTKPSTSASTRVTSTLRTTTSTDRTTTCTDRTTTCTDRTTTCTDRTTTCKDRTTTSKDRTTTSKDRTTTCKDRTTTSKDRTTTCKDRTTTCKDRTTTCKDRTTTCKDRTTSCKDRTTISKDQTTTQKDQTTISKFLSTMPAKCKITLKSRSTMCKEPATKCTKTTTCKKQKIECTENILEFQNPTKCTKTTTCNKKKTECTENIEFECSITKCTKKQKIECTEHIIECEKPTTKRPVRLTKSTTQLESNTDSNFCTHETTRTHHTCTDPTTTCTEPTTTMCTEPTTTSTEPTTTCTEPTTKCTETTTTCKKPTTTCKEPTTKCNTTISPKPTTKCTDTTTKTESEITAETTTTEDTEETYDFDNPITSVNSFTDNFMELTDTYMEVIIKCTQSTGVKMSQKKITPKMKPEIYLIDSNEPNQKNHNLNSKESQTRNQSNKKGYHATHKHKKINNNSRGCKVHAGKTTYDNTNYNFHENSEKTSRTSIDQSTTEEIICHECAMTTNEPLIKENSNITLQTAGKEALTYLPESEEETSLLVSTDLKIEIPTESNLETVIIGKYSKERKHLNDKNKRRSKNNRHLKIKNNIPYFHYEPNSHYYLPEGLDIFTQRRHSKNISTLLEPYSHQENTIKDYLGKNAFNFMNTVEKGFAHLKQKEHISTEQPIQRKNQYMYRFSTARTHLKQLNDFIMGGDEIGEGGGVKPPRRGMRLNRVGRPGFPERRSSQVDFPVWEEPREAEDLGDSFGKLLRQRGDVPYVKKAPPAVSNGEWQKATDWFMPSR